MFDFPASPSEGQTYSPAGGPAYVYRGSVWMAVTPGALGTAQARNRIVNPAMQVSQEWGDTAGGPVASLSFYAADNWVSSSASGGTQTAQRVQVPTPNKSRDRLRITVNTADVAIAAGDVLQFYQSLEGIQIADFGFGTVGARQVVLRFGFKGPAGTYAASLRNGAANRTYVALFTITAGQANTDTEQIIVIPGDTAGVWGTDEARGALVAVCVACGATYQAPAANSWQVGNLLGTAAVSNGMATAGNVFELFDVGLYLDPLNTGQPPRWQLPDYGEELIRCMRYWQSLYLGQVFGQVNTGTSYFIWNQLAVVPRSGATMSGANYLATSFPAASGTVQTLSPSGVQESRVCNLTATFGRFASVVTINGRM